MAMSNPAFGPNSFAKPALAAAQASRSTAPDMTPEQLDELYGRASAGPVQTDRMSYDDVIVKTLVTFAFVLGGGVLGFFVPQLYLPFMFVGLALALVNIFKKQPSAPLVLAYGFAEGVFLGGLSRVVESNLPGIIYQALIGTAIVFGVTLVLFVSGKVRASKRATKVFLIAGISYALFSVVNLVLQFTGVATDPWGLYGASIAGIPLGLIIGPLAILMAAYSLVLDFTAVKQGVEGGAPRNWGWKAAFGLVLTIVWLYVEMLRLISIFRSN
jgi:uncharacterized YccA/Bax inhibitor family protein